jgi:Fe-S-cluster containining protein
VRTSLPRSDQTLVQIVDAALAESSRKSGDWLVCRLGCTQGMDELTSSDPERAVRIRKRAEQAVKRLAPTFPGDPKTGILGEDEDAEAAFAEFANDEPCPALDPATGACDLYNARPMTCRTFGPPVRSGPEEGLAVCELCYHGATDQQIAACEMSPDPDNLEEKLIAQTEKLTGKHANTIVAFCLAH